MGRNDVRRHRLRPLARLGTTILLAAVTATVGGSVTVGSSLPPPAPGNDDDYPTFDSTGPRYAPEATTGDITTTHDGQVIERVLVEGKIEIRHDHVVVRDVVVMGTGRYSIDIDGGDGPCPTDTLIEYTEIDMVKAPPDQTIPLYQKCPGSLVADHLRIHNMGRGVRVSGNFVLTNSYVHSELTWEGAHRTALSTHGGDNFTVVHNTFICELDGCSSAVNMYSDYAPVTDYLFADNLVVGGSICLRGGETHQYQNQTRDIRILHNRFSTRFFPLCGRHQTIGQFDEGAPGNVRQGNVFHESGEPVPGG